MIFLENFVRTSLTVNILVLEVLRSMLPESLYIVTIELGIFFVFHKTKQEKDCNTDFHVTTSPLSFYEKRRGLATIYDVSESVHWINSSSNPILVKYFLFFFCYLKSREGTSNYYTVVCPFKTNLLHFKTWRITRCVCNSSRRRD